MPSALILISRPEHAPTKCSLATEGRASADHSSSARQRRYAAESPSNSSMVLLLFDVVDIFLNVESIPLFYSKI